MHNYSTLSICKYKRISSKTIIWIVCKNVLYCLRQIMYMHTASSYLMHNFYLLTLPLSMLISIDVLNLAKISFRCEKCYIEQTKRNIRTRDSSFVLIRTGLWVLSTKKKKTVLTVHRLVALVLMVLHE